MATAKQEAYQEFLRKRSLDRVHAVMALTDKGMTHKAACDKLGLNHFVMSRNVRAYKRSLMTAEEAMNDIQSVHGKTKRNQEVVKARRSGMTLADIGKKFGISATVVWRILRRAGVGKV